MDEEAVRAAIDDAVAAMLRWGGSGYTKAKWWPHDWCTFASFIIAGVLHDRGLGDWTIVNIGTPDGRRLHDYLEWTDVDGSVWVIDATIHQFPDIATEPYFGPAPSPAAAFITKERARWLYTECPWGREVYQDALAVVREEFASRARE